jgi:gas vesicle protein
MDTNNKNTLQETGRWLRVTVLTLTTVGPIVNALAARLRERGQALREASGLLDFAEQTNNLSQEFLKRSSEATRTLAERRSKATQAIAERSGRATQAIAERSSEVSRELAERSSKATQAIAEGTSKASQELVKRGGELTQEVKLRSSRVTQQLPERDGTFWTIFGFSIGLTAASIAAYLLIRRRLQQQAEENEQFLLSNNGHRSVSPQPTRSGEIRSTSQTASPVQAQAASAPAESVVAIAEPEATKVERPANATLIGVVSTKLYYPVETPLDQLAGSQEGPLDVVYFTSEEEAKAQGFVAA